MNGTAQNSACKELVYRFFSSYFAFFVKLSPGNYKSHFFLPYG